MSIKKKELMSSFQIKLQKQKHIQIKLNYEINEDKKRVNLSFSSGFILRRNCLLIGVG